MIRGMAVAKMCASRAASAITLTTVAMLAMTTRRGRAAPVVKKRQKPTPQIAQRKVDPTPARLVAHKDASPCGKRAADPLGCAVVKYLERAFTGLQEIARP